MDKVKLDLTFHSDGRVYLNGALWPMCSIFNVSIRPPEPGNYAEYLIRLSDPESPFQRPWSGSYHFNFIFYYDKVELSVLALLDDHEESYRVEFDLDFNHLYSNPYSSEDEEEDDIEPYWVITGPISIKRVLSDSCRCL